MKELKWSLLRRDTGILATVTSVEKPVEALLKNANEYEKRYLADLSVMGLFDHMDVVINSAGGLLASAWALADILNDTAKDKPVRILIAGQCSSAATMVAFGCDAKSVDITPGSCVMIHVPKAAQYKPGAANSLKFLDKIVKLETVSAMVSVYKSATGKDRKTIKAWMEEGKRFSAIEAVDAGFCGRIISQAEWEKM